MDMQLFILGLIATAIYVRNSRSGITFAYAMIGIGVFRTGWNAWTNETTATLMTADPIPEYVEIPILVELNHTCP